MGAPYAGGPSNPFGGVAGSGPSPTGHAGATAARKRKNPAAAEAEVPEATEQRKGGSAHKAQEREPDAGDKDAAALADYPQCDGQTARCRLHGHPPLVVTPKELLTCSAGRRC